MAAIQPRTKSLISYVRDIRVLQIIGQIIFAIILIAAVYGLPASIFSALSERNLTPNLTFLQNRAGFDIGEKPEWYSASSTYWEAYTVGFANTIRIVVAGLVLSTVIGIFLGIFLLSANWLLRTISYVTVEFLRNTPLLVQLFIWYFVVMLSLPTFQQSLAIPQEGYTAIPLRFFAYIVIGLVVWRVLRRFSSEARALVLLAIIALGEDGARYGMIPSNALRLELQPWVFFNIRGFAFPEILPTGRFAEWLAFVALGAAVAFILWIFLGRVTETTGQKFPRVWYGFLAVAILAVVGWAVISAEPTPSAIPVTSAEGQPTLMSIEEARAAELLTPQDELAYARSPLIFRLPEKTNFRYTVGTQISPEYMALLLGLTIYTSAFIAEIVRAGILAVPKGQVEAARALGLSYSDVLRMIILPQALRVIIPPLGNQYLNLTKNSSLAIAIAYADLFQITATIMNQSGQSVTGMSMVMLTYLILSLIIAAIIERANRRFQLVTR